MVKMVEITSELIPNPLVKMVEKLLPHEDETYSLMLTEPTSQYGLHAATVVYDS